MKSRAAGARDDVAGLCHGVGDHFGRIGPAQVAGNPEDDDAASTAGLTVLSTRLTMLMSDVITSSSAEGYTATTNL